METDLVRDLLDICIAVPHTEAINDLTIQHKQQYKIKTPDAIIAASCIFYDLPLLTADSDFSRIENLDIVLIEL